MNTSSDEKQLGILLAAIDIGSNAIRLLLSRVFENKNLILFHKEELVRISIRLGEDVFLKGKISDEKTQRLIYAMRAYSNIMQVYNVVKYKAVATSAVRDAANGKEVIQTIEKETGIKIEILDGKTEANLIFANHIEEILDPDKAYMYIDVGGGSTEITIYNKHKVVASRSFNIGTLRLLYNTIDNTVWEEMKQWIKKHTQGIYPIYAIGSGGNINKLYKMSGKKENKSLGYNKLKGLYEMLLSYTYEERVKLLGLKPDRADVIVPAAKIYLTAMKTADIEKIYVPQIGLSDGVIHQLYEEIRSSNKKL
ncbi:MAG: exopolyphosphatase [Bacteroidetes bacterium]|nr:MAG: exopolyphosphatase [Bacteroidota bacterium]